MAKLHTYLLTMIVLILLFHFAGLLQDTGTAYILDYLGVTNPANLGTTQWWITLSAITSVSLVGTAIGIYYGKSANIVLLPQVLLIAGVMFLLAWDIISLFLVLQQTNVMFATMIISPIFIIYTLTVVEWIRGMTT